MKLCEICNNNLATQRHHLYAQYKRHRKLYPEYIDHPDNIMLVCADCHLNSSVPHKNELDFCDMFGIVPRSKSGLQAYKRRNT